MNVGDFKKWLDSWSDMVETDDPEFENALSDELGLILVSNADDADTIKAYQRNMRDFINRPAR